MFYFVFLLLQALRSLNAAQPNMPSTSLNLTWEILRSAKVTRPNFHDLVNRTTVSLRSLFQLKILDIRNLLTLFPAAGIIQFILCTLPFSLRHFPYLCIRKIDGFDFDRPPNQVMALLLISATYAYLGMLEIRNLSRLLSGLEFYKPSSLRRHSRICPFALRTLLLAYIR